MTFNDNNDTNKDGQESEVRAESSEIATRPFEDTQESPTDADPSPQFEFSEPFPTVRPAVVRVTTLRSPGGPKNAYSIILTLPKPVVDVCGLQVGDAVLVEAWANGMIRMRSAGEEI